MATWYHETILLAGSDAGWQLGTHGPAPVQLAAVGDESAVTHGVQHAPLLARRVHPGGHALQEADTFANKLCGVTTGMTVRKLSQRAMVFELNALGVKTPKGNAWNLSQLQRTLRRLERK